MSSKVNLLREKIAKIQVQLKVEMAKNSKVSDGTLPIPIGKKETIVKRTAIKVIKRPEVIGSNDKRKRYVNPITLNYVLRPAYLAALRKIKKNNEEL